jgi:hypothetical protein
MTVRIACVTFDCADALAVGRFWSAAIGRPLDAGSDSGFASIGFHARRSRDGWAPVGPEDQPSWIFAKVPEPKTVKNRLHLDLVAAELEIEIGRLVQLGATRIEDREEYGYSWTLMADPEGNEFDVGKAL